MKFIPRDVVLAIQERLIKIFGGIYGVRDEGLLDSALAQPEAVFNGSYLHTTVFQMAAAYGFHIAKDHPFLDGNKRTAASIMVTFLELNEVHHTLSEIELYQAIMDVVLDRITKKQLATILSQAAAGDAAEITEGGSSV